MDKNVTISICVPTWNRTDLVIRAIEKIVADERINDITIIDDGSDVSYYDTLLALTKRINVRDKISVWRNQWNLDCYANKNETLMLAMNEWCILLDSDNIIDTDYIDALYALPTWDKDTFYCPEFARPHFDYREFADKTITKQNVHSFVGTKAFDCLINTANYFVNRTTYMNLFNKGFNPHAADTIYMNSRLLESGGKMYVVPGLQYFHDVHKDSHYKANHHKSDKLFEELRNKLNEMK
jgi:glycosyltransferase involved in cell wall biosynthesis